MRVAQTQPEHDRWAPSLPSHPTLLLVIPVGSLEDPLALAQLGQVRATEATPGFQLRKANIRVWLQRTEKTNEIFRETP